MIATGKISEARKLIDAARAEGKSVGFVPTMGALHAGHRSLIHRAREENDYVVVSIFVNPTQFNEPADLAAYPRTFGADLEACADEGTDLVFHPEADEMYPEPSATNVSVGRLTTSMEGAHRPGHFDGVALVCTKLFNIVGACNAYFGEKDAQQLRVVHRMASDLDLPVNVIGCPTIRDSDGLALSSRNVHLSPEERRRALALPGALREIQRLAEDDERSSAQLVAAGRAVLADVDAIDYIEVVDPESLEPLEHVDGPALVCAAVWVGETRLIDNVAIPEEE